MSFEKKALEPISKEKCKVKKTAHGGGRSTIALSITKKSKRKKKKFTAALYRLDENAQE